MLTGYNYLTCINLNTELKEPKYLIKTWGEECRTLWMIDCRFCVGLEITTVIAKASTTNNSNRIKMGFKRKTWHRSTDPFCFK